MQLVLPAGLYVPASQARQYVISSSPVPYAIDVPAAHGKQPAWEAPVLGGTIARYCPAEQCAMLDDRPFMLYPAGGAHFELSSVPDTYARILLYTKLVESELDEDVG